MKLTKKTERWSYGESWVGRKKKHGYGVMNSLF